MEQIIVSLLLIAAGYGVIVYLLARNARKTYLRPFQGLWWQVNAWGYCGPCCSKCLIQYVLRPAVEPGRFHLICGVCFDESSSTFSLAELLQLEEDAHSTFQVRRLGVTPFDQVSEFLQPTDA